MESGYTFENLELITGGDPALDVEMLEAFLMTSREYIDNMRSADKANDYKAWNYEAHAMKGACFNIGVDRLGEICQAAQLQVDDAAIKRLEALHAIETEFTKLEKIILDMIKDKKSENAVAKLTSSGLPQARSSVLT